MRRLLLCIFGLSGGLLLGGCVDRYVPDVPPAERSNLVVDGFINPLGTTVIRLSRTFSVNTKNTGSAEARARVTIQDETGRSYSFTEGPAGTYTSAAQTLDPARQYQLRITTAQGRTYASDLLPVVLTPPITDLTWQVTPGGGAEVFLSTRGANNAQRFYRWEYAGTWQFASPGAISPDRRVCWRTDFSTAILQSNTTQLSQNSLIDFPLLTLLPGIELKYGYSVLVRQVTQTQGEYDYWERLRKSTENLGTVNDPLPSRVTGNMHALADPAEPVLGYVGVHSVTEKRLFINGALFPTPRPETIYFDPAYANCVGADAPAICSDCTLRGTNAKPSFWP